MTLQSPCVSVIIPALDEEQSIGAVIEAIPRDLVGEIIVVDGGSRDSTPEAALARGARVVTETQRGYGRACARGISEARGEVVVVLDADGAADPGQIPALVAPVLGGTADLALGSRLHPSVAAAVPSTAMPIHQRFGNVLGAFLIRALHGVPVTDLSPFRAARRAMVLALPIEDLTYGWPTEMIIKAAQAGWRIAEVPVSCSPRSGGRSKVSGTLRGTMLATWHILATIAGSAWAGRHRRASPRPDLLGGATIVVVMAKLPEPGKTKTRLCPRLTPDEAADLYEALLGDTLDLVSGLRGPAVAVAVSPPRAIEQMARLAPPTVRVLGVEGADIGECLHRATQRLFRAGFMRVLAINSDSPTLPAEYIGRAVELLSANDVVMGPAEDGGYYLIGLRQQQPGLFVDIAWSSPHVVAQTLECAGRLGLTVARLPPWYDVDTPADLDRLRAELAVRPIGIAPRTRAFLARC